MTLKHFIERPVLALSLIHISYPNSYDQVMFGTVRDAWNMGRRAVRCG